MTDPRLDRVVLNPHRRADYRTPVPSSAPLEFHQRLPDYAPTPLRQLLAQARSLGVGALTLKDEGHRFGLPAYKVLGASWAIYQVAIKALGRRPDPWENLAQLREHLSPVLPHTLVTATDGNHGRGVARVARWLGLAAEVYVPRGTVPARIHGIESEGATVIVVDGTYDAAVAQAAERATPGVWVIQDHGFPGYEEIPQWVAEGYETLLAEAAAQRAKAGLGPPNVVMVQIGVGTLASAAVRHFRSARYASAPPLIVGVEPVGAACALASIEAGHPTTIEVDATASIMAGLNCGTPSTAAWPDLTAGIDAYVAVTDDQAREAVRALAAAGVVSGESGAAGVAGLLALGADRGARRRLGISPESRVFAISTESATDPDAYRGIVEGA